MRGWRRHIRGGAENRSLKNPNPNVRSLGDASRGQKLEAGGNDLQLSGVQGKMPENPRRGSEEGPEAGGAQGPDHDIHDRGRERGEQSLQRHIETELRVGRRERRVQRLQGDVRGRQ